MTFASSYLASALFEFKRYKNYGDVVFDQPTEEDFFWQRSPQDNSIAIIVKHMSGNMQSRWTNFLKEDGEKSWRERDQEFTAPPKTSKEVIVLWEKGWNSLFQALDQLSENNLDAEITIRGEKHSIPQAINRQLAHYASHVGQIVFIGKTLKKLEWKSPTIPKGGSKDFNKKMFGENS